MKIEKRHPCRIPYCEAKPFIRHYDLEGHLRTGHLTSSSTLNDLSEYPSQIVCPTPLFLAKFSIFVSNLGPDANEDLLDHFSTLATPLSRPQDHDGPYLWHITSVWIRSIPRRERSTACSQRNG